VKFYFLSWKLQIYPFEGHYLKVFGSKRIIPVSGSTLLRIIRVSA
jgi:hypothetical protein